ncbi:MAG: DUF6640 family protein [Erythrobacter sp.]|nr:hypothetical protein [Erythrobacter sp.]MDZ4134222.1 DUF6640 family protein [Paracoccaceae bacterium]MDZ4273633.1 DUF6640 family protein [Erythrobacter sp.]
MNRMIAKIVCTVGLLFIAIGLPALEISPTHVFNPNWPPHALFHEVWQLLTDAAIAVLALYLTWTRDDVRLASLIGLAVMGGAVAALALGNSYGGAITYEGGPALAVLGVPAAVLIPVVLAGGFVLTAFAAVPSRSSASEQSGTTED